MEKHEKLPTLPSDCIFFYFLFFNMDQIEIEWIDRENEVESAWGIDVESRGNKR